MTTRKDFKRLVRRRMQKTGEAYTTARIQILQRVRTPAPRPAVEEPPTRSVKDYPKLAGMSDAAIKAGTGCTWERWVKALDSHGAQAWPHRRIAEFVRSTYKVGDWWCQTVTVGYERIKGLRAIGQRRDGAFEASKSRTFPVPLTRLYRAWNDEGLRSQWLTEPKLAIRAARPNTSLRMTWPDQTSVEVMFYAKPGGKSQVAIQHRKLPDRDSGLRMKAYWAERLDALAGLLSGKGGPTRATSVGAAPRAGPRSRTP
jgi:uncharacterized protein YndB with AHSA1/START domain